MVGCGFALDEVTVDLAQTTEAQLTLRRQSGHSLVIQHGNHTAFEWTPPCNFHSLRGRFQKLDCGEGGHRLTVLLTGISEQDAGDYVCHQGAGAGPEEPGCGVTLVVKAAPPVSNGLSPGQIAGIVLGVISVILLVIDIACCHCRECGVVWTLRKKIQGWWSSR